MTVPSMPDATLSLTADTDVIALPLTEDESLCERRAGALYNAVRRAVEMSVILRISGMGAVMIAWMWINQRFWAAWQKTQEQNGQPTHGQWVAMIVYGQLARPFTLFFGKIAERSIERRRNGLPKDHAHALSMDDAQLHHLSLLGLPVTLTIGSQTEIVEFAAISGEMHVRAGDTTACVWFVQAEEGNTIAMTNIQEPVTDVTKRNGCIEIFAGQHSTHLRDNELASILELLQDGEPDIMSDHIESTSLSTNAAQTVRFELLP